ncbi:MAG: hypothetical protein P8016_01390 [Sedimentisphaerales bacterium]
MKKILTISILLLLNIASGCTNKAAIKPPKKENVLLAVDFQEDKTLRYEFTCERETSVDFNPSESAKENNKSAAIKSSEKLDITMAYTPISIDPYGLTTIKAVCERAKVTRNENAQADPAEYFQGKTFTFTVDPRGKIHDYSQLEQLIKQAGGKAFTTEPGVGRLKLPDMIGDFVATQWFLWDSISSIKNPSQGVHAGQNWTSQLSVPTPMVSRLARNVTYKLDEIRPTDNGRIAVINCDYSESDSVPQAWPVPYTGRFRMSGTFGLLSYYKLLDLTGKGRELFNIDSGQIEEYTQRYDVKIQASVQMGISIKPLINIRQTISMKQINQ